jgi:hypothetical protein
MKAVKSRIAMVAPERVQKDEAQQCVKADPMGSPHGIVASTFWAIWHHD